jgi:glycerate 2-kinase
MSHLIKNFSSLASTPLRRDALALLESGLAAVATRPAVRALVKRRGDALSIGNRTYDLNAFGNVYVIAIGKSAFDAGAELEDILGPKLTDGLVLDVKGGKLKRLTSRVGTHPFPSLTNMKATGEIIALLKHVEADDLVIVVVSGGGSALLCWPSELSCTDLTLVTKELMRRGAAIREINTFRKHVSEVQGGQLAALAHPAQVVSLIFSDVPGDDLSMVASGPTFLDDTTAEDARQVLEKYRLMEACRLPSCNLKETPKDPVLFRNVRNVLAVSARQAVKAMEVEAKKRGYRVRVLSTALAGEAREVGKKMAEMVRPGEALLACGETTVTIEGSGKGGRNQELALGALAHLPEGALVLSCDSDGVDHVPVAGALVDAATSEKAARKGLDPAAFLTENDPYPFFQKVGDHVKTGITGLNVADLMLAMRAKKR